MSKLRTCLLSAFALATSYLSVAFADGRATGQTIEYEITQTSTNKSDYSSLPGSIRARAEQNQAAANGKKTTTNLTMTIDSIDADGNGHVKAKYTQSMEGISGIAANVLAGEKEFQGTLTADGRVLPTFDPNATPIADSHGRLTNANAPNTNAQVIQGTFGDVNTFITGVAKRPKFKMGDVWHLSVQDATGITRQYDFSVTELDPSNSSAAVISMKSELSSESTFLKISASGHYDAARRILTTYHAENSYGSSSPNGIKSSGMTVENISLRK